MKNNYLKEHIPEIVVIGMYIIIHFVLRVFHEGCFDETHAWNIAKDGTLFEIIFKIPYYEGHPSLWYLLLYPFAHLGATYNLTMTIVTTFFTTLTVILIEVKSPFPRMLKTILPFTYFICYQYGIIARPYCMTMLAIVLVALLYAERDNKPIRYSLSLLFLCSTTAFGFAIAGGMALVWLIKIVSGKYAAFVENNNVSLLRNLVLDKRLYCLVTLLLYAVIFLFRVLPLNPYGGMNYVGVRENGIVVRLLYLTLGLFSDLFLTNSYSNDMLADFKFLNIELVISCVLGAALLFVIVMVEKKIKMLSEFLIPFITLSTFSCFVYFCVHNSGLLLLLLIYVFWISWDKLVESFKPINSKMKLLPIAFFIMPLVWTVSASITDIAYSYSFGEREATYIKNNGLEKSSICFEWNQIGEDINADSLIFYDMKHIINMDRLYAFLDNPNFVNWPLDYSLYTYFHREVTLNENMAIVDNLNKNPLPDVLIGEPNLYLFNESGFSFSEKYVLAYREKIVKPWKNTNFYGESEVFFRKDIFENMSD